MDILEEMDKKKKEFDNIENKVQQKQKEVNDLVDELKRLQGEYRLLIRIGQNEGLLDNNGNKIQNQDD